VTLFTVFASQRVADAVSEVLLAGRLALAVFDRTRVGESAPHGEPALLACKRPLLVVFSTVAWPFRHLESRGGWIVDMVALSARPR
jgi:hypothetical protein